MRVNGHKCGWQLVMSAMIAAHMGVTCQAEQRPQAANSDAASVRALSSKLQLLDRLVHGSELVERVSSSEDYEAKHMLSDSQALWEQAETKYEAGNYVAAEDYARQGLKKISVVSRRVTDDERILIADRERYVQLRKRVLDFNEAFNRVVSEKQGESIGHLLDQQAVNRLLLEGEKSMREGNYTTANQRMTEAAEIVEVALVRARHKDTLLHVLEFDSPEEEYRYEQQRNSSYKLLVDILEKEKADNEAGLARMRDAVDENVRIREMADRFVEQGDIEAGIKTLEEGSENLARVLRMSGLVF